MVWGASTRSTICAGMIAVAVIANQASTRAPLGELPERQPAGQSPCKAALPRPGAAAGSVRPESVRRRGRGANLPSPKPLEALEANAIHLKPTRSHNSPGGDRFGAGPPGSARPRRRRTCRGGCIRRSGGDRPCATRLRFRDRLGARLIVVKSLGQAGKHLG